MGSLQNRNLSAKPMHYDPLWRRKTQQDWRIEMPDPSRTPTSPPPRPRFREIVGKNVRALSLVPREQRFYDLFEQQATILVSASVLLKEALDDMGNLLAHAVAQLEQAVGKLRSGKKDGEYAIEVHRLEDVGDSTSRRAIAELFQGQRDPLEVIKLKDLYGLLEDALDRCEDVANVIENIAIKNA